ncbi:hypothetical protein NDU88_005731 [Pleurodeles waltl]|uniref:Uncharacterized protein n=1 Tax=Pleurodeles waltl TaxID=8319 RepID=A0AAV7WVI7_PLEWA|nr:hypothetical protein NDU88_005731 [Pleurodeles waltl]
MHPLIDDEDSDQMEHPAESTMSKFRGPIQDSSVASETPLSPECAEGESCVFPSSSVCDTMIGIQERQGGARYDLRPRPAAPVRLQDYVGK